MSREHTASCEHCEQDIPSTTTQILIKMSRSQQHDTFFLGISIKAMKQLLYEGDTTMVGDFSKL